MLFPLDFTPFEAYYFFDDRSDYPTTYPIELRFRGTLRRDAFYQAIATAVVRHPLLAALAAPRPGRTPQWIDAGGLPPTLDWISGDSPCPGPGTESIDLRTSVGWRVRVHDAEGVSHVQFRFHHACCDALGALRFIEDLLVIYHCLIVGQDHCALLRPIDIDRLKMRGDYGLTESGYRPNLRDIWDTARFWATLLFRKAVVLAPSRRSVPQPTRSLTSCSTFVSHPLTSRQLVRLRAVAAARQATVNDVLLRDLFLTLDTWNAGRTRRGRGQYRINLPVSLRQRQDRWMSAANVLGFWFLTRKPAACGDRDTLLDSIRAETHAVKKWRLPLYFVGGLGFAQSYPAMMRWVLRRDHSFATIVFSNTGRILGKAPLPRQGRYLVCGNAVLEHVAGVPPVRPGTHASMVLTRYGGQTLVHLMCDPLHLKADDRQQLLNLFVDQLNKTLEVDP